MWSLKDNLRKFVSSFGEINNLLPHGTCTEILCLEGTSWDYAVIQDSWWWGQSRESSILWQRSGSLSGPWIFNEQRMTWLSQHTVAKCMMKWVLLPSHPRLHQIPENWLDSTPLTWPPQISSSLFTVFFTCDLKVSSRSAFLKSVPLV